MKALVAWGGGLPRKGGWGVKQWAKERGRRWVERTAFRGWRWVALTVRGRRRRMDRERAFHAVDMWREATLGGVGGREEWAGRRGGRERGRRALCAWRGASR